MLIVDLRRLGKQVGPAIQYLNSKLEESLTMQGAQVKLASTKAGTAKLLLHKFLHQKGLENYRVVVVHPGLVEMLPPKSKKRHAHFDDINLFPANETIPYYQAAAK